MFETLSLPFVQRGMVEVAILAVAAGLVGTWIVLRGLTFFAHAVGTAAFPGLVLADGLAFSAHLGALGTAGIVGAGVAWLGRGERNRDDTITALVLVAALATGVILASDVFHSGANVETLLFGSLLVLGASDIAWAAGAAAAALVGTLTLGPRWLAAGFDPATAAALRLRPAWSDAVLIGLVALVAIATLSAVGALLTTALLVVPAATTRLFCQRMRTWQLATVGLAAAEGVVGLWASVELNAPPGPAIAVLAGTVFALVAVGRPAVARVVRARRPLLATAAALALLALAGCGDESGTAGGNEQLKVVATTTQLGDLVRAVGGDAVDVTQILRPNTDPHDYEPRPRDVRDTADARLVIRSGDELDTWMDKVVAESGAEPRTLTLAPRHTPYRLAGERTGADASRFDPHWWHDPRNVEAAVAAIRDALVAAHPTARPIYVTQARRYLARVRALDRGIVRCIASVPADRRKLVTDHDALGYFARRYRIHVVGAVIPSQSTAAQASAGGVADLARVIEDQGVTAVFPETSVNAKLARAIARETGATARYTLYGDTLGPPGSSGATYLVMERHNADAMVRGFTQGRRGCRIAGI